MTRQQLGVGSIRGLAVLVSLALALSACGGGGSSPSGPSGPTRQVVGNSSWRLVQNGFEIFEVNLGSGTGTLDATVQWTFSNNDVDLFVTNSACTVSAFQAGLCTLLARADSATNKPERVTLAATTSVYRFVVFNWGPSTESGTLEVAVTR